MEEVEFQTKDSGERIEFNSGMQRDIQTDKPRFDLLIADDDIYNNCLLTRWANLMDRGDSKYGHKTKSINIDDFIKQTQELLKCQNVEYIEIKKFIQKDTVEAVTKNVLGKTIQRSQKDKEKIDKNGKEEIPIESKNSQLKEGLIQNVLKEIEDRKKYAFLEKSDLQKKQVNYYWKNKKINAKSVKNLFVAETSIWIMTIQQDTLEDTYVMAATEDLECWETILWVLKKLYNIYENLSLINLSIDNLLTMQMMCPRNWELANSIEEFNRFKSSAWRHFIQTMMGEIDEDHFAAILFNLNGMLYLMNKLNIDVKGNKVDV